MTIDSLAEVKGDVFAGCQTLKLNGIVPGTIRAMAQRVVIAGTVKGDVNLRLVEDGGELILFAPPLALLIAALFLITIPAVLIVKLGYLVILYLAQTLTGMFLGRLLFRLFRARCLIVACRTHWCHNCLLVR